MALDDKSFTKAGYRKLLKEALIEDNNLSALKAMRVKLYLDMSDKDPKISQKAEDNLLKITVALGKVEGYKNDDNLDEEIDDAFDEILGGNDA